MFKSIKERTMELMQAIKIFKELDANESTEKKSLEKYRKEIDKVMNTGNSFKEKMVEQVEKFGKWTALVTDMLKSSQEIKNDISALNELDTALNDLKEVNEQVVSEIDNEERRIEIAKLIDSYCGTHVPANELAEILEKSIAEYRGRVK